MIAVIPTCRSIDMRNVGPLIDSGVRFLIVDDSENTVKIDHPQFRVVNWSDRRRILGRNEIAIPRRNGACRDFGFYLAWKESDDDEIIIALDDDCMVESPDFVGKVRSLFRTCNHPTLSSSPPFYNHFDLFEEPDLSVMFPRGFPYANRITYQPYQPTDLITCPVLFNLGLWKGAPDINAIDRIGVDRTDFPEPGLRCDNIVLPHGTLTCVCSGSMQFRRSVIPAVYQLPMMVEIMPGWHIDRYGDIWAGYILKTLLDIRGDRMSVGGPLVRHLLTGPMQRNIRREHIGHLVNEEFLDILESMRADVKPGDYLDMMRQVHEILCSQTESASPLLRTYLRALTVSMGAWISALMS